LSLLLVSGMLAAFFHLTKTGIALGNSHDLEHQTRMVLQYFARDVHQAEDAAWIDAHTLRLSIENETVEYAFNAENGTFIRRIPAESETALASGIASMTFTPFDRSGTEISLASGIASAGANTKMIQLSIDLSRKAGNSETTASIISSRYMLRNKRIDGP